MTGLSTDFNTIYFSSLEDYFKDPVTNTAWITSFKTNPSNKKIDMEAAIRTISSDFASKETAFILTGDARKVYKLSLTSKEWEIHNQGVEFLDTITQHIFTTVKIKIQGSLIPLTEAEKFFCNVKGIAFDE
jgi:hypothetical protein